MKIMRKNFYIGRKFHQEEIFLRCRSIFGIFMDELRIMKIWIKHLEFVFYFLYHISFIGEYSAGEILIA